MRVFPFKSLEAAATGKPALANSFIMQYPCVIGRFGAATPEGRMRYTWLEAVPLSIVMRNQKEKVTIIENPERLDQLLNCLATLGGTDGLFVEPLDK